MRIDLVAGAVLMLGWALIGGATADAARITVLSSRPDLVSGGDVLVAVRGAGTLTLNGVAVTGVFKPDGHGLRIGLVEGLKPGANILGIGGAKLVLTNHSSAGPIFSGPREMPFYCMTDKFPLPASKEMLGAPLDADCSVKTRVDYVYRTNAGTFKPLPAGAPPDDLVQTTTSTGNTVPYIVRVETGTINRAIYQTAVLADPAAAVGPTAPPGAWNGRLVYTFGGGCSGGWYIQGANLGNRGILEDLELRQGFALASASLNVFSNNCGNIPVAAETAAMVKERFIKTYGVPKFTIGLGCSGGSEQVLPIGDAYPGLVDGIILGCSYPEAIAAMNTNLIDAGLMAHYFGNASLAWSDAEKTAVTGYPSPVTQEWLSTLAVRVAAQDGNCNRAIPQADRYNKEQNPGGARCDVYDHIANVLGKDPKTGIVRRPIDNVGVQYGLSALLSGAISSRQFLDLNRAIGGYDQDGNFAAGRSEADPSVIQRIYEAGLVTNTGLGLKSTPIIDYRGYVDAPENKVEEHARFHSFSMRARLVRTNGSYANQVMLIEAGGQGTTGLFSEKSPVMARTLTQMDQWLTKLNAGHGARPSLAAIASARPADLTDACFTDAGSVKIEETQVYRGDTKCNRLYPAFSTPRMVAGEPLTNDVLKCRLKPIAAADYAGKLDKNGLADLRTIFPHGVCDFRKAGVGQVRTKTPWPAL
jgi:hypothetical protein